jgi:endogenous inhibitor of DNA gyrase (YacG/DUF329 family)
MRKQIKFKQNDIKMVCSRCGNEYLFQRTDEGKLPYHFPFCSTRCKDIDFLAWVSGDVVLYEEDS